MPFVSVPPSCEPCRTALAKGHCHTNTVFLSPPECDGSGRRIGPAYRCGQCANATLNKPEWRTGNRGAIPFSKEDWTRYNPWRSPGLAPIFDSCGMAGGGPTAGVESGQYNTTRFAKQGDVGSELPVQDTGVGWKAGGLGQTGWYIRANHGSFISILKAIFSNSIN